MKSQLASKRHNGEALKARVCGCATSYPYQQKENGQLRYPSLSQHLYVKELSTTIINIRNILFNYSIHFLVGGFNPFEKDYSNWKSSPSRGENKKYLKPPPSQYTIKQKIRSIDFCFKKTPWYLRYPKHRPNFFPKNPWEFLVQKFPWDFLQGFDPPCPTLSLLASAWRTSRFCTQVFGWIYATYAQRGALMCVVYSRNLGQISHKKSFQTISHELFLKWRIIPYIFVTKMKKSRPENVAIHEDFPNPTRSLGLKGHVVFTLRTKNHPESVEAVYDRLDDTKFIPSNFRLFFPKKTRGGNQWLMSPY